MREPTPIHDFDHADFTTLPTVGQSRGVNSSFEVRQLTAELSWRGVKFATTAKVAEPGALGALGYGLLGREDFFKAFVVRFMWHRDPPWMQIDPSTPKPGPRKRKR